MSEQNNMATRPETCGATNGAASRSARSLQLPLALIVVALFLLLAFQSVQLFRQRENLIAAQAAQTPLLEDAAKLSQQLDALVAGTLKLAGSGNASAKAALEELHRQGISLTSKK
jgi:hypothetical protein